MAKWRVSFEAIYDVEAPTKEEAETKAFFEVEDDVKLFGIGGVFCQYTEELSESNNSEEDE